MQRRFKPDNGGEFPEWEEKTLGDCITLIASKGYTRKDIVKDENKPILFSPSDINDYGIVSLTNNTHISDELFNKSKASIVKNGDILFTKTASIGKIGYVKNLKHNATINPQIVILRANNNIDSYFLFNVIRTNAFIKQIKRISCGTAVQTMSQEELKKLTIIIPKSIEEQKKIAEALASFDEMIATKTAKLEYWQECKKRMMKELFERTKRFKDDDGNEYPEWEEKMLYEVCESVSDGSHFSPKTVKDGKMMLSIKDMNTYGFDFSNCKHISAYDFNNLVKQNCKPKINDVLLSKDGSVFKYVFKVDKEIDAVLLSSIAIIRPNMNLVDSEFLVQCFKNTHLTNLFLRQNTTGTAIQRVVLKNLKNIKLPIPCVEEQKRIGNFLYNIDNMIEIQRDYIKTYKEAKKRMLWELLRN